jgi:hypothetical protein
VARVELKWSLLSEFKVGLTEASFIQKDLAGVSRQKVRLEAEAEKPFAVSFEFVRSRLSRAAFDDLCTQNTCQVLLRKAPYIYEV